MADDYYKDLFDATARLFGALGWWLDGMHVRATNYPTSVEVFDVDALVPTDKGDKREVSTRHVHTVAYHRGDGLDDEIARELAIAMVDAVAIALAEGGES